MESSWWKACPFVAGRLEMTGLDNCNALTDFPKCSNDGLQFIQSSAAWVLYKTECKAHQLPVSFRIDLKIILQISKRISS